MLNIEIEVGLSYQKKTLRLFIILIFSGGSENIWARYPFPSLPLQK